jgi:hypothetical protein
VSNHTGGCRCGAVRFEASVEPNHVSYCHCSDCRKATGAPVTAFVGFAADQVSLTGDALKTLHAYVREQLPYLHMPDGLPRHLRTSVPRPDGTES